LISIAPFCGNTLLFFGKDKLFKADMVTLKPEMENNEI